jgi:hypothetical protein
MKRVGHDLKEAWPIIAIFAMIAVGYYLARS